MVARAQAELQLIIEASGIDEPVVTVPGHPATAGGFVDSNPPRSAQSGRASVQASGRELEAVDRAMRDRGYQPIAAACAAFPGDGDLPPFVRDDQVFYRLDRTATSRPPQVRMNISVSGDATEHPVQVTLEVAVDHETFEFVELGRPRASGCP